MNHPAALITGAARRVGAQIAIGLAHQGFDIAIHYQNSETDARQLSDLIKKTGRRCEIFKADLSDIEQVLALMTKVKESFKDLNLLINNVSVFYPLSFKDTTPEQFDGLMNLHLKAPFFLTQQFVRNQISGMVINMTDAKIETQMASHASYLLSKKALAEFTRLAAKSYAPQIRVNAIAPGPVLWSEKENPEYQTLVKNALPLKKTGSPQNILTGIRYLIENEFVTGEILYISGGQHL